MTVTGEMELSRVWTEETAILMTSCVVLHPEVVCGRRTPYLDPLSAPSFSLTPLN